MADKELKIKISTEADTTGAKSAENSIKDLREETDKIPGKTSEVEEANKKASSSYTGLAGNIRNASYQFQDIFVQISSGQGVMRALSQQLPQMLSGFGLWGVALGAVAAAAPLVFSAFSGGGETVKEETDKSEAALDDLKESIADLTEKQNEADWEEWLKGFEDSTEAIRKETQALENRNKVLEATAQAQLKVMKATAEREKAEIDASDKPEADKVLEKAEIDRRLADAGAISEKEAIDRKTASLKRTAELAQAKAIEDQRNEEKAKQAQKDAEERQTTNITSQRAGTSAKLSMPGLQAIKEERDTEVARKEMLFNPGAGGRRREEMLAAIEKAKQEQSIIDDAIAKAEYDIAKGDASAKQYKKIEERLESTKKLADEMAKKVKESNAAADKANQDAKTQDEIAPIQKKAIDVNNDETTAKSLFESQSKASEIEKKAVEKRQRDQEKADREAQQAADKARREQERKERDAERERERRAKVEADGPSIAFSAADQARGLGLSEDKVRYLEQIGKQIALPGDGSKAGTDYELMQRLLKIVESIVNNAPKNGKSSTEEAGKMRDIIQRIDNLEKRGSRTSKMF